MYKETQEELLVSKKRLEGELYELRDLNSNDICEINKIKYELDQQTSGATQMVIEEESQEQLIQIQIGKIESISNKLELKV